MLLGFNWYLYGHKLKWQNAVEYNYGENVAGTGEDEKGYGFTSALRISW
jgi:phosphate-selective porin OprO/OprP